MSVIKHTALSREDLDLTHASAAGGNVLLMRGYSVTQALGFASRISLALQHDTAVRGEYHHAIGNPRFDDKETDSSSVQAGLEWLLRNETLEEPYGLELGHVVNIGTDARSNGTESITDGSLSQSARAASNLLLDAQHNALESIGGDAVNKVVPHEPGSHLTSYRSALFTQSGNTKKSVALGAIKQPVADIYRDDVRVETHLRKSFGMYVDDGALDLDDIRTLLDAKGAELEDIDLIDTLSTSEKAITVFPLTVTLVGLRRAAKIAKKILIHVPTRR